MNDPVTRVIVPTRAALGGTRPLRRRQTVLRLVVLAVAGVLGLVARFTGVLHGADPVLPPLEGVAQVAPQVLRAGTASETELMLLRESLDVRGVVAVGTPTVEEQAVTRSLGMKLLTLDLNDADAPSPEQIDKLVRFVHATTQDGGAVFLHDDDGNGPVLVVAGIVQLVDRVPLSAVLAQLSPQQRVALSPAQNLALRNVAAALERGSLPTATTTAATTSATATAVPSHQEIPSP
jgi:hypothetical protein